MSVNDHRYEPYRMYLLMLFAEPQPDSLMWVPDFIDTAFSLRAESVQEAIKDFLAKQWLQIIPEHELPQYLPSLKVNNLKRLLRNQGLKPAVKKDDLIEQLIVAGGAVLVRTSAGKHVSETYWIEYRDQIPHDPELKKLTKRTLLWLLGEGVLLGVVGNFAYDVLKQLVLFPKLTIWLQKYYGILVVLTIVIVGGAIWFALDNGSCDIAESTCVLIPDKCSLDQTEIRVLITDNEIFFQPHLT